MQIHPRTFPQQWASKVRHWNYNILHFRLARRRSPLPILRGVYHSLTIGYFSYGVWENLRGAYRSLIISDLWDLWDVWGNLSASGLPPDAASSRLDAFAGPPAQVHHHHKNVITLDIIIATSPYHRTQISTHHHHIYVFYANPKESPIGSPLRGSCLTPSRLATPVASPRWESFTQVREEQTGSFNVFSGTPPLYQLVHPPNRSRRYDNTSPMRKLRHDGWLKSQREKRRFIVQDLLLLAMLALPHPTWSTEGEASSVTCTHRNKMHFEIVTEQ